MLASKEEQNNLNLKEIHQDLDCEFAEFTQVVTDEDKKITSILKKDAA